MEDVLAGLGSNFWIEAGKLRQKELAMIKGRDELDVARRIGEVVEQSSIRGTTMIVDRDKMGSYHGSVQHVLQYFNYAHLPRELQAISKPFADLAITVADGSNNPETTVALRKLLEAKDAAVHAAL